MIFTSTEIIISINKKNQAMNYHHLIEPNLLGKTASRNIGFYQLESEVGFINNKNHQYEIFIEVDKKSFNDYVGSPSKLYRMLSNSNQTTGYVQNRIWWGSMFSGGEYYVYETPELTGIHYKLELTDVKNIPSELQVKWRFAKAMRGLRFNIEIGKNSEKIKDKLRAYEFFLLEHRYIGQWYKEQHQSR